MLRQLRHKKKVDTNITTYLMLFVFYQNIFFLLQWQCHRYKKKKVKVNKKTPNLCTWQHILSHKHKYKVLFYKTTKIYIYRGKSIFIELFTRNFSVCSFCFFFCYAPLFNAAAFFPAKSGFFFLFYLFIYFLNWIFSFFFYSWT